MALNISSLNRNTVDVWTGEVMLATGQASLAIMAIGVFSACLFSETSKIAKFFAAIGFIGVFAYNLVLAGRTLILLSMIILSVALIYAVKNSKLQRKRNIAIVTLAVLLIILVIYTQNLFGIRDWILGSNLSTRFDMMLIGEDSRLEKKQLYFVNMLKYPFGGGNLRDYVGGYAHELYLDVYSDVGVVGYVSVIAFVFISVINLWRVFKREDVSRNFKLLSLCIYIAILIEFLLEPIIQGVPWLFCTFCFYSGLLKSVRISDAELTTFARAG